MERKHQSFVVKLEPKNSSHNNFKFAIDNVYDS